MRRYWAEDIAFSGTHIPIQGDLFHHIFKVCRTEKGNVFELLGAKEQEALIVKVVELTNKMAIVEIIESRVIPKRKLPHIHVHLSIPKIPTFEVVLEKAVELGVSSIQLFTSDFSSVKDLKHKSLQKADRWKKIITSATQQTGRADLLQLQPIVSLEESLNNFNQNPNAMGLFAYEGDASLQWKEAIQSIRKKQADEVHCYVGSEGGFSNADILLFNQYGLKPMTMGDQVLRVETACVALISSLKYELEL